MHPFPTVDVIFAGPDATGAVLKDLTTNKPDNIIIYGYSRGGVMAVGLANELAKNGQVVNQLTTVDPACKCQISDFKIADTTRVQDAVNLISYPFDNPVIGAQNVAVSTNSGHRDPTRNPPTPVDHEYLDDITSNSVINRMRAKLKELNQ